jgi:hypothetical protein
MGGHRLRFVRRGSQAKSPDDQHHTEDDEPETEEERKE